MIFINPDTNHFAQYYRISLQYIKSVKLLTNLWRCLWGAHRKGVRQSRKFFHNTVLVQHKWSKKLL